MKGIESPLHHLKPGTEEYKKVEAELIRQISEVDLGDESRFDLEQPETTDKAEIETRMRKAAKMVKDIGHLVGRGKIKR